MEKSYESINTKLATPDEVSLYFENEDLSTMPTERDNIPEDILNLTDLPEVDASTMELCMYGPHSENFKLIYGTKNPEEAAEKKRLFECALHYYYLVHGTNDKK